MVRYRTFQLSFVLLLPVRDLLQGPVSNDLRVEDPLVRLLDRRLEVVAGRDVFRRDIGSRSEIARILVQAAPGLGCGLCFFLSLS